MAASRFHVSESESESSSDSDGVEPEEVVNGVDTDDAGPSRPRRELWCGVETHPPSRPVRPIKRVVWPPSPTSGFNSTYIDLNDPRYKNPKLGSKMQLWSKTGYMLGVYPDGKVRGIRDPEDAHTFLEIMTGGMLPEHVKIRGTLTNLYVAMNKKGRLYAESDPNSPATVFVEMLQGAYNVYLSRNYAHLGWYLGIKKSGRFKKGSKTKYGQKAIKFLAVRSKFE